MRLNDWKRDAEEYRAVDQAALEQAEAEIAKAKPTYLAKRKIGRCTSGAERGKGYVYHAVSSGWTALCGAEPGRMSAGWQSEPEPLERVTCPRCMKKLGAPL